MTPSALDSASPASRRVEPRTGPLHGAVLAVALLALAAAALAPTLGAGFVFDDRADAVDNPAASPAGFAAALGRTNRPLTKASYALQRATTGAAPLPFHAGNLALHLAATLLVLALARRILERSGAPRPRALALAAAALWALHPVAVESVAPVTGRPVLLSTVLALGALLRVTGRDAPARGAAVAAAALALAAPLARETALVLPALGLVWQATLGAGEPARTARRRQLPLWTGAAAAVLLIALTARHRELIAFSLAERPPLDALRGNLFALPEILRLWLDPAGLSIDPPLPAEAPWSAAATLTRAAGLVAAAALAWTLRRRAPLAAFGLAWTLVALAPANSILWRLDPVSARPLYLAGVGAGIGIVGQVALWLEALRSNPGAWRLPEARVASAVAALALLAATTTLASASAARARLWADPIALWADAATKAPRQARPTLNLGVELLLADRLDEAEAALRRAVALDPGETNARCALDAIRIRRLIQTFDERTRPL